MRLTPKNIWNFKQNKPSQVVDDVMGLRWGTTRDQIYKILLQRGIFKWLAVRRDLIRLKNAWKDRLKDADFAFAQAKSENATHPYHTAYLKGYRMALMQCREEVRFLCHSPRWQAPDNDREAQRWLDDYGAGGMEKVEGK